MADVEFSVSDGFDGVARLQAAIAAWMHMSSSKDQREKYIAVLRESTNDMYDLANQFEAAFRAWDADIERNNS